jgi:hypothetical protein
MIWLFGIATSEAYLARADIPFTLSLSPDALAATCDSIPPLALGVPSGPERLSFINPFVKRSACVTSTSARTRRFIGD